MKILLLTLYIALYLQATDLTMELLRSQERIVTLNEFKAMYQNRKHIQVQIQRKEKHSRTRNLHTSSRLRLNNQSLKSELYNKFYNEHNTLNNRRIHIKQLNRNDDLHTIKNHINPNKIENAPR